MNITTAMDWTAFFQTLLFAVVTAAVPVLTAQVIKVLSAWFKKNEVYTEQLSINNTVKRVENLILDVVTSTTQTFVDELKKHGTFDEEAQREAFEITKNTVMELISEETMNILVTLYQDVDTWINNKIEKAVFDTKKVK